MMIPVKKTSVPDLRYVHFLATTIT
uniref:Uncharacterized protein n=1 Tax=Anguilla anguilla TaxID=7936 RepID=A0A0E9UKL3_ANGAN